MTSSFGLTFTRDDLIKSTLRVLGVIGQTQNPTPEDYSFCSEALNLMIKAWVNKGATLWKIQYVIVPMIGGVAEYPIGPSGGFLSTLGITISLRGSGGLDGAYALGISDVGGGTGATGTYVILGGKLSSITITLGGSAYKTPVLSFPLGGLVGASASITPVGLTRSRVQRVLDQGNFIRNNLTDLDQPIFLLSRSEYNRMGNKTSGPSVPSQFWYDPEFRVGNDNGILRVFSMPQPGLDYEMHLNGQIILDDTTAPGDLFDFPQEFLNVLKWGLAFEVLPEYGVDDRTEKRVTERFQTAMAEAFAFSVEEASTYFTYDLRMR